MANYDEQGHTGMNEPDRIDFTNAVNRLLNPNTPMLSQPMLTPQASPQQYYRDPATAALNQFGM
jgi:hypothetical protein